MVWLYLAIFCGGFVSGLVAGEWFDHWDVLLRRPQDRDDYTDRKERL